MTFLRTFGFSVWLSSSVDSYEVIKKYKKKPLTNLLMVVKRREVELFITNSAYISRQSYPLPAAQL